MGRTLCHPSREQKHKGQCSSGRLSTTEGRWRGFHDCYVEAMFLLPLGFMVRVGVSYPSLVIQVVGLVSTYCAWSHPARDHPVSRIISVVYSHGPMEPSNEITKGPLWPFLVFLTTSLPLPRTWGAKWVSRGFPGLCQEGPDHDRRF